DVLRLPPGGSGPDLLALRQFPVSVLDANAAGPVRPGQHPRVGADGRHSHDVRQLELAWLAAVDAPLEERADGARRAPGPRLPAEHHRVVRPLAADAKPVERLDD